MHRLVLGIVVVGLAAGWVVAPAATANALDNPGLVAVALVDPSGHDVALAGAAVEVTGSGVPDEWTTTAADGTATISEPVGHDYTVVVTPRYTGSSASYAPARVTGVDVEDSSDTGVPVVMRHGATITGAIDGPTTTPPVGWRIDAVGLTTGDRITTTTDAEGRYGFVGLATDTYRFEATPPVSAWPSGRQPTPTVWDATASAQQDAAPAQHLSLARHYVHTTYDLELAVTAPTTQSFAGATLTVLLSGGGTTTITPEDTIGATHVFAAILPTGSYRMRLDLPGVATAPARVLWFTTYSAGGLAPDPAAATDVGVAYPFLVERTATVPAA